MGDAAGADAGASRVTSEYGVSSRTVLVYAESAATLGTGTIDSDPSSMDPEY